MTYLRMLTILISSLLAALATAGDVQAHRLVVECRVLADHQVEIEGWYDSPSRPNPAREAKVQVFRSDGQLLTEGQLDMKGLFRFTPEKAEALKVVVTHTGHREEIRITAASLGQTADPDDKAPGSSSAPEAAAQRVISSTDRNSGQWIKDVLVGVSFLLAVTAFVLSLRNAQKLQELTRTREEAGKEQRGDNG